MFISIVNLAFTLLVGFILWPLLKWISKRLFKIQKTWPISAIFWLGLTGIFWGDALVGYAYFKCLCNKDGGYYQSVSSLKPKGIYDPAATGSDGAEFYLKYGFSYVIDRHHRKFYYDKNGSMIEEINNIYPENEMTFRIINKDMPLNISKKEYRIDKENKNLAVKRVYIYRGGWLDHMLFPGPEFAFREECGRSSKKIFGKDSTLFTKEK